MIERCATVSEALAQIHSIEELEGYSEGLREFKAETTTAEWAAIADKKIEFQQRASTK